ncbi:MAG: hypothetical protein P4L66_04125 [Acetobacteraceae bacterium]|nr:hypothetical protein [Acetobacteraceae bacterium]
MAKVAAALSRLDPEDSEAVTAFYQKRFCKYSPATQALISEFLVSLTDDPSDQELLKLKKLVSTNIRGRSRIASKFGTRRAYNTTRITTEKASVPIKENV